MPAALKITGLVKDFPKGRSLWAAVLAPFNAPREHVLDGLDLTVHEGEICALLGPNGAGKSTLLRIVSGTVAPTRGTVEVGGVDQAALGQRLHEKVGLVVGDERSFYARLTAAKNLAFFAAMHGYFGAAQDERAPRPSPRPAGRQTSRSPTLGRMSSASRSPADSSPTRRSCLRRDHPGRHRPRRPLPPARQGAAGR